jgi:hypothetical protein
MYTVCITHTEYFVTYKQMKNMININKKSTPSILNYAILSTINFW